jgi:hypothetical protein
LGKRVVATLALSLSEILWNRRGYFSLAAMWVIAASAHSSSWMLPRDADGADKFRALVFDTKGVGAARGLPTLRILLATSLSSDVLYPRRGTRDYSRTVMQRSRW